MGTSDDYIDTNQFNYLYFSNVNVLDSTDNFIGAILIDIKLPNNTLASEKLYQCTKPISTHTCESSKKLIESCSCCKFVRATCGAITGCTCCETGRCLHSTTESSSSYYSLAFEGVIIDSYSY